MTKEKKAIDQILEFVSQARASDVTINNKREKLEIFIGNQFDVTGGLKLPEHGLLIQRKKDPEAMAIISNDKKLNRKILKECRVVEELKDVLIEEIAKDTAIEILKPVLEEAFGVTPQRQAFILKK